jgi:hypothetical protein
MDIELLVRIQRSFEPGYGIKLFYDEGTWGAERYGGKFRFNHVDWISPDSSKPYHNTRRQMGFIIYKEEKIYTK